MKIILNEFPPSINKYIGRTNFREYQKSKKDYAYYVRMQTVGINPKYKECNMTIEFYFKDNRGRDVDNYLKLLLDSLKQANIIEDDNFKCIRSLTLKGIVDKDNPRIEINIEEIV